MAAHNMDIPWWHFTKIKNRNKKKMETIIITTLSCQSLIIQSQLLLQTMETYLSEMF